MIQIEEVKKKFGRLQVLKGISVLMRPSAAYALIGPNGSGKTTLLKSVLGLVRPDSGDIQLNGQSILGQWQYRQLIGYMAQISRYPENMTPVQIINMVKDIRQSQHQYDMELFEEFKIKKFENKPMHSLSGGMRQKVNACLAFMFQPAVIILDEPTAGLDPLSTEILKEKINGIRQKGKLVIITSHILSDLDEMITHVIYLNEGNKIIDSTLEQLHDRTKTEKLSHAIASIMNEENNA